MLQKKPEPPSISTRSLNIKAFVYTLLLYWISECEMVHSSKGSTTSTLSLTFSRVIDQNNSIQIQNNFSFIFFFLESFLGFVLLLCERPNTVYLLSYFQEDRTDWREVTGTLWGRCSYQGPAGGGSWNKAAPPQTGRP